MKCVAFLWSINAALMNAPFLSVRGFKAHGRNGLVILRVTDTATHDEQNMARIERNSLSSTISLLSAGVNKIQQLLEASNQAALQRAYSGSLENLSNLDQ